MTAPAARPSPYDLRHKRLREQLAPLVRRGGVMCREIRCLEVEDGGTREIHPASSWDLAHDRERPGEYLGPAHSRCNRSEGARYRELVKLAGQRWLM